MSDTDMDLNAAFQQLDGDPIDETGYYREAFASFRGEGSGLRIGAWIGVLVFSAGLIFCLIRMMTTPSAEGMIIFGVWAVLCNQAQIALKLWFNMQLNRRAVTREVRRLGLLVTDR